MLSKCTLRFHSRENRLREYIPGEVASVGQQKKKRKKRNQTHREANEESDNNAGNKAVKLNVNSGANVSYSRGLSG